MGTPVTAATGARLPWLRCAALDIAIGGRQLVAALDFELHAGELVCVIGCNGAGKTTLLHTLAGLRETRTDIALAGRPLGALRRREIAQTLALLLQQHDDAFPTTVRETVLAARHPHQPLLGGANDGDDEAIADEALARVGLAELAGRDVATLSGGERQRVAIAATFAQRTQVLLLDEPLNNLDPRHRIAVMRSLAEARDHGVAILAVMHDVNLVERFADRVLLLYGPAGDARWLCAVREQALTADNLTTLYDTPVSCTVVDGRRIFVTS